MRHPALIGCYGWSEDEGDHYIVYELMDTNLAEFLTNKKINLESKLNTCIQVSSGVQFLHSKSVVHRDIKPDNILIKNETEIKICDFGLSKKKKNYLNSFSVTVGKNGTDCYIAPEIVEEDKFSTASDVYSLGGLFFFVLTGKKPFSDEEKKLGGPMALTKYIIGGNLPGVDDSNFNVFELLFKDLTLSCLKKDPKARPSISQIISRLKFLKKISQIEFSTKDLSIQYLIAKYSTVYSGHSILDAGCGFGNLSLDLSLMMYPSFCLGMDKNDLVLESTKKIKQHSEGAKLFVEKRIEMITSDIHDYYVEDEKKFSIVVFEFFIAEVSLPTFKSDYTDLMEEGAIVIIPVLYEKEGQLLTVFRMQGEEFILLEKERECNFEGIILED
jgi:serine/threonine protein kinase